MAKKARSAPAFSVLVWATLDEAFDLAKAALGFDQALRDLRGRLISGSLPSAVRRLDRDGTEISFEQLDPAAWKVLRLQEVYDSGPDRLPRRTGREGLAVPASRWDHCGYGYGYRVVLRVASAPQIVRHRDAKDAGQEAEPSTHRKPGRKTTKNWRLHVAGELHRIVVVENKPVPAASELATFCVKKLNYHPDIRAVQRLVKLLIG